MNIFNQVFGLLLNSLPYFILCFVPVWNNLKWKKSSIIIGMLGLSLANMLSTIFFMLFYNNWDSIRIPQSIIILCLYIFLYVLSIKVPLSKGIFIALFVKFYADLITSMAKFLEQIIWKDTTSYGFNFNLMHFVLLGITFPILWWFLSRRILPAFMIQSTAWRYFWLFPAIFYVLNFSFSAMNTQIISSWQYILFNVMLFISSGATILIALRMLESTRQKVQLEEQVQSMNHLLALQGEQYLEITKNMNTIRAIKHDIRHQMAVLNNYVQSSDIERLKEYMKQYIDSMPLETETLYCKNYSVNAIASHYLSIAHSEGINVDIKMEIPEKFENISDVNLCIIIGNFLENALEACQRMEIKNESKRFIQVRVGVQNEFLVITVDNSFDGINYKKDDKYVSRKKQSGGYGLESVKAVVKNHGGYVECKNDKNVFYSSALIKI